MIGERERACTGVDSGLRALHITRPDLRGAGRQKGWRWTRATLRELITLFEDQEGQDLNYAVSL